MRWERSAGVAGRRAAAVELGRDVGAGVLGLHQPQEERAQRGLVADRAVGLGLGEPGANGGAAVVGDLVGLAAARAGLAGVDQAVVGQPVELGVDLRVAGRPGRADRGLEALGQLVAAHRPIGEQAEQRVAEHLPPGRGDRNVGILTCQP
jgi:hypothetical protein